MNDGDIDTWWPGDDGLLPLHDPRHPFHLEHMAMALEEARAAMAEDEVPVGAVVVSLDRGVIGRAGNQRERLKDPTAVRLPAPSRAERRQAPGLNPNLSLIFFQKEMNC